MNNNFEKEIHDECGVFGIYGVENAASLTYYGLHSLQHRGQEGCGILSVDEEGEFHRIKGKGLVTEVFKGDELQAMKGSMALGHVLWSMQPICAPTSSVAAASSSRAPIARFWRT